MPEQSVKDTRSCTVRERASLGQCVVSCDVNKPHNWIKQGHSFNMKTNQCLLFIFKYQEMPKEWYVAIWQHRAV